MPSDILPIWSSHYSLGDSILTLEEAGRTAIGNPASIVDLARENHLSQVVLVDVKIDGFLEAFRHLSKPFKPSAPKALSDYLRDHQKDKKVPTDEDKARASADLEAARLKYERESRWSTGPIQPVFGLKLCVCADMNDKSDESLKTESNVIIFVKGTAGYSDLIRISNRAWTDGFYYKGRADWKLLKTFWTDNLALSLPFFSSFIARNTMTFANIVPDFPVRPTLFREVDSGLPFAPILDRAVDKFAREQGLEAQPVKSIYYAGPEDYDAYTTFRAIHMRGEFARPNVDHMCSDRFSWQDYLRLTKGEAT